MNQTETLTAKQRAALAVLAAGGTMEAAAAAAGVGRTALYRWRKRGPFAEALRELDAEALALLGRRVMALGEASAQALEDALGKSETMKTRLQAAGIVLDKVLELHDMTAILSRLDALETAARSEAEL